MTRILRWSALLLALGMAALRPVPAQEDGGRDAGAKALEALVEVLGLVDDSAVQIEMLKGMTQELRGRQGLKPPAGWASLSAKLGASPSAEVRFQTRALAMIFGDVGAFPAMRAQVADREAAPADRKNALDALVGARDRELPPLLHALVRDADMRDSALRALAVFDDARTPTVILDAYATFDADVRRVALNTLASRPSYARLLLEAVRARRIPSGDVPTSIIRQLRNLKDQGIDAAATSIWGSAGVAGGDKEKEIARLKGVVLEEGKSADASRGRALYAQACGQCHLLFGAGGKVGPDLTGSNRADLDYLLGNIVDPNALIGEGYKMFIVKTKDELTVSGLLARKAPDGAVTIVNPTETRVIPAAEIESLEESPQSMMPEGQLSALPDPDVRDLIAYLRGPAQVPLLATPENVATFFNGKDLAGWIGCPDVWTVENGEIVGKTATGLKRNEFLRGELLAGDFRLVLQVKLVPDGANSGIQFRSESVGDGEVKGYQADIGAGWWGKLYEEHGRAVLWKKSGEAHVKKEDWNTYEILAVGSRIRTAVNGNLCVDLDDPPGARRGIIAFQVHSGGATEVRFKDLQVELNPAFELKTVR